jgi:hypothetical protein
MCWNLPQTLNVQKGVVGGDHSTVERDSLVICPNTYSLLSHTSFVNFGFHDEILVGLTIHEALNIG